MTDVWTIRDILNWTSQKFKQLDFPTPLLDAQLLLSAVMGLSKIQLYTEMDRPLSHDERGQLKDLVRRRLAGEPVAYLLSQKYWHDLDLFVDKRVLIPRPETESLLDFVMGNIEHARYEPQKIFDFCTGSGCLAIALARRFPNAEVVGVDISEDALEVARQNAQRNKAENVVFETLDVCDAIAFKNFVTRNGRADVVVANPPYVSEAEWYDLEIGVSHFEPRLALVADDAGCAVEKKILAHLAENLFFEDSLFFAMEGAEGHPQKLVAEPLTTLDLGTPGTSLPVQQLFALNDLERRARYLCYFNIPRATENSAEETDDAQSV